MEKLKNRYVDCILLTIYIILFGFFPSVMLIITFILIILYMIISFILFMSGRKLERTLTLYSVHIFGKKRRGKDLLTQKAIINRFKKKYKRYKKKHDNEPVFYLSNIDYGYGCKVVDLKDFKLINQNNQREITYNDFINGVKIKLFNYKKEYEGLDLYVSDSQLYLPNTEHNALDKAYPSFPVFFALSGQLYDMNIIVNTQEYNRLWVKLRGQQDYYIKALSTFPMNKSFIKRISKYIPILRKYIFVKLRLFEEQQSAENNILPFKAKTVITEATKTLYLTSGQATKEQFDATNGKIQDLWIAVKYTDISYDTRIFLKILGVIND